MTTPEPFDRKLRRLHRDRASPLWKDHAFLQQRIAEELIERLADVQRSFSSVLMLGHGTAELSSTLAAKQMAIAHADPGFRFARSDKGVQCDEDRLPFRDASFDLIFSVGLFDTTNDLPGALTLARRCLKPDGLFLAGFPGAGSLPVLKRAMLDADIVQNAANARIHPQIDVRAAGDLLGRAGFALPVADRESLDVRYSSLTSLIADLRGSGLSSLLNGPSLSKSARDIAEKSFASLGDNGRTTERFEIIFLTAWAPSPDQPKPAKRGSGSVSLSEAFKKSD
ncbi:MAG: methyltransferase domain-containing protein [Sphingomonadaceae bacterium]|nr:methyltransferase domain-containing protein [Sphingomonadaceae bacterium]